MFQKKHSAQPTLTKSHTLANLRPERVSHHPPINKTTERASLLSQKLSLKPNQQQMNNYLCMKREEEQLNNIPQNINIAIERQGEKLNNLITQLQPSKPKQDSKQVSIRLGSETERLKRDRTPLQEIDFNSQSALQDLTKRLQVLETRQEIRASKLESQLEHILSQNKQDQQRILKLEQKLLILESQMDFQFSNKENSQPTKFQNEVMSPSLKKSFNQTHSNNKSNLKDNSGNQHLLQYSNTQQSYTFFEYKPQCIPSQKQHKSIRQRRSNNKSSVTNQPSSQLIQNLSCSKKQIQRLKDLHQDQQLKPVLSQAAQGEPMNKTSLYKFAMNKVHGNLTERRQLLSDFNDCHPNQDPILYKLNEVQNGSRQGQKAERTQSLQPTSSLEIEDEIHEMKISLACSIEDARCESLSPRGEPDFINVERVYQDKLSYQYNTAATVRTKDDEDIHYQVTTQNPDDMINPLSEEEDSRSKRYEQTDIEIRNLITPANLSDTGSRPSLDKQKFRQPLTLLEEVGSPDHQVISTMLKKNDKNCLITNIGGIQNLGGYPSDLDLQYKKKLSKILLSNQNTITGSSLMVSNTQDEETSNNLNQYNCRAMKFLNTNNMKQSTKIKNQFKKQTEKQAKIQDATNTEYSQKQFQSQQNTKGLNTLRQSRDDEETLVNIESVRENTPNRGTAFASKIQTQKNSDVQIEKIGGQDKSSGGTKDMDVGIEEFSAGNEIQTVSQFSHTLANSQSLTLRGIRTQSIINLHGQQQQPVIDQKLQKNYSLKKLELNPISQSNQQSILIECFKKIPQSKSQNRNQQFYNTTGQMLQPKNVKSQFILSKLETIQTQILEKENIRPTQSKNQNIIIPSQISQDIKNSITQSLTKTPFEQKKESRIQIPSTLLNSNKSLLYSSEDNEESIMNSVVYQELDILHASSFADTQQVTSPVDQKLSERHFGFNTEVVSMQTQSSSQNRRPNDSKILSSIIDYCQKLLDKESNSKPNPHLTVKELFKVKQLSKHQYLTNASTQSIDYRYLVNITFWRLLCKKLNIYNKPLVTSFNNLTQDQGVIRNFVNHSKVITEEDSFEEDSQLIEDYLSFKTNGLLKVNNQVLIKFIDQNGNIMLKENIRDGKDFVSLPQEVWNDIRTEYQVDIEIKQEYRVIQSKYLSQNLNKSGKKPPIRPKHLIAFEEDDNLLANDDQHQEIENYIIQKNLQFLDQEPTRYQNQELLFQQQPMQGMVSYAQNKDSDESPLGFDFGAQDDLEFDQMLLNAVDGSDPDEGDDQTRSFQNDNQYQQRESGRRQDVGVRNTSNIDPHYNQMQDSERSNFTQESFSPPESQRDNKSKGYHSGSKKEPLNMEDLARKLEVGVNRDEEEKDERQSENFTLNQSPSDKNSLLYSFQGQMTSNFPNNLKDTQTFQLRDIHKSQPNLHNQEQQFETEKRSRLSSQDAGQESSQRHNQSESDSNRFNGSFFKQYDAPRINNFERSTLIKFEEFTGSDQLESDPHRKYSERISDRIYESVDQQQQVLTTEENLYNNSGEDDQEDQSPIRITDGSNPQQMFFNHKNLPLFIITEEEQSESHSQYNTFNRVQSITSNQDRQGTLPSMELRNSDNSLQGSQLSRDHNAIYQKSKSQPIYNKSRGQRASKDRVSSLILTDNSVDKPLQTSPNAKSRKSPLSPKDRDERQGHQTYLNFMTQYAFNQSRQLSESPLVASGNPILEQDQISQLFQRQHSRPGLKDNSLNQNDFMISEEDLLSNVDRMSKLPNHDFGDDDFDQIQESNPQLLIQRLRECKRIIEHLSNENQKKSQLIISKENQLNLLQIKNDSLLDQVNELQTQISDLDYWRRRNYISQETQTHELAFPLPNSARDEELKSEGLIPSHPQSKERKKIRPRKKTLAMTKGNDTSGGASPSKKTPQRQMTQEPMPDLTQYSGMSKQSSASEKMFDTPQLKQVGSLGVGGSPQITQVMNQNLTNMAMSKRYSMSFNNMEDVSNFRQQLVQMRQKMEETERKYLEVSEKAEQSKSKRDKMKQDLFNYAVENKDLLKSLEDIKRQLEVQGRDLLGKDLTIQELEQLNEELKAKLKQREGVNKETQVDDQKIITKDQEIQTDLVKEHPSFKQSEKFQGTGKMHFTLGADENPKMKDSLDQIDHNMSSNSSLLAPQIVQQSSLPPMAPPNNITIINNRPGLKYLMDQAKSYEQISHQLQQEIAEHKKLLRDNHERANLESEQFKELRRKVKKREHKIDKLRLHLASVEKENLELKAKVEEAQKKVQDVRMKMESKLQEKEFKIMTLKNQIKHLPFGIGASSGIMTPVTSIGGGYNPNKMYTQNELLSLINNIVQNQIINFQDQQQRKASYDQSNSKNRAKSHDQPFSGGIVSFNEDDSPSNFGGQVEQRFDPRIPINQPLINPSIFQQEDSYHQEQNYNEEGQNDTFFNNQIGSSPSLNQTPYQTQHHQYGRSLPATANRSHDFKQYRKQTITKRHISNQDLTQLQPQQSNEIQQIFNTSMKRITQEIESLKNVGNRSHEGQKSDNQSYAQDRNYSGQRFQNKSVKKPSINSSIYPYQQQNHQRGVSHEKYQHISHISEAEEFKRNTTYEDSLATQPAERELYRSKQPPPQQNNSYDLQQAYTSFNDQPINVNQVNRGDNPKYLDSLENEMVPPQPQIVNLKTQNMRNSMQNTHTFRQRQVSISANTPKHANVIQQNEVMMFNNTLQDKEQNVSIFYDFKPAFENSGFTNNSALNNTLTRYRDQQPPVPITKFETNLQSLDNSIKQPLQKGSMGGIINPQHVRLQSNMISRERTIEDDSVSSPVHNQESHTKVAGGYERGKSHHKTPTVSQSFKPKDHPHFSDLNLNKVRPDTQLYSYPLQLQSPQPVKPNFAQHFPSSGGSIEQSKSSLSNYSQKLEDIRKKYGRIN